jgi:hypothetical protein
MRCALSLACGVSSTVTVRPQRILNTMYFGRLLFGGLAVLAGAWVIRIGSWTGRLLSPPVIRQLLLRVCFGSRGFLLPVIRLERLLQRCHQLSPDRVFDVEPYEEDIVVFLVPDLQRFRR